MMLDISKLAAPYGLAAAVSVRAGLDVARPSTAAAGPYRSSDHKSLKATKTIANEHAGSWIRAGD
jgi:hypothetical protein